MKHLIIEGRKVGADQPPYIIAEMSANHGGDKERAMRIIDMAAECGADAIKFQAYTPDSMTLNCDQEDFVIKADNPWKGRRLHELYGEASTPYEWFPEMYARAREKGVTPFSTPFATDCLELLEELDNPVYKIASFEIVDLDLIAACAKTGKPLIMSVGMCTEDEISDAVNAARSNGCKQLSLLKCNSSYPADPKEARLSTLKDIEKKYDVVVGYSDHTLGSDVPAMSVIAGASIIEKHVIDAREPATADSTFSALPDELKELVEKCNLAYLVCGQVEYGPTEREKNSLVFRRSLYISKPVSKGDILSRDNIRCVRPGFGLAPKHMNEVDGKKAKADLAIGTRVSWDVIE